MNRECSFTQVIKQIIKHHPWDLTVWLHMLELRLMVMLLVRLVLALERRCLWSCFFFFFFENAIWLHLSNWISPQTNMWFIHLKWIHVDMILSRCYASGNPHIHIFEFILYHLIHLIDLAFFDSFSHQILIDQKHASLSQFEWIHILSPSALCWW